MHRWLASLAAGLTVAAAAHSLPARQADLIRIDGPIGPATAGFIDRALDLAADHRAECLIIQLDTPGGLLDSTKEIVQSFYRSQVPTVVFVAPAGANAGSAGVFITLAADVAAMAPNTSIGAAHPVALGGTGEPDETMKQKLENFAVSYIEAIASKRDRNVEWAKAAVKDSASITSEAALEKQVIDLLAVDVPELLRELDGRAVDGRVLTTAGATVTEIPMNLREKVFQVIWRPEVMFILMLVAIYGIIGELSNPGAIFPGVVGAIALILALYMGSVLPVNVAGIALLVVAVALFVTDVFAPTHGILTVGGIVAFFLGSLLLFDSPLPAFRLSLRFVIPATVLTAAFFLFVVGKGLKAQFLPVRAGRETMLGKTVTALAPVDGRHCQVFVEGESWRAACESPVAEGDPLEITGFDGLTLLVKPSTLDDRKDTPWTRSPASSTSPPG